MRLLSRLMAILMVVSSIPALKIRGEIILAEQSANKERNGSGQGPSRS